MPDPARIELLRGLLEALVVLIVAGGPSSWVIFVGRFGFERSRRRRNDGEVPGVIATPSDTRPPVNGVLPAVVGAVIAIGVGMGTYGVLGGVYLAILFVSVLTIGHGPDAVPTLYFIGALSLLCTVHAQEVATRRIRNSRVYLGYG